MDIKDRIKDLISLSLKKLGINASEINLEHPGEISHGDYSSNVAMVYGKKEGKNPRDFAEEIVKEISKNLDEDIEKVETAGPGFINFYLSESFFSKSIFHIYKTGESFGKNTSLKGKKVMIEYTDPNPFKELHAGHLMSNSVGESVSRLVEFAGADLLRANYQGDVGPHVAKAVWGMLKNKKNQPSEEASLKEKISFIGRSYVEGATAYKESQKNKDEIDRINKSIYEKDDSSIMTVYNWGRKISLLHFEKIYKKLDTSFDYYFFESETAERGKKIVKEGLKEGIFEESKEAVVFKGEQYGLHTRVFITSLGLPTYETKDLGLNTYKFEKKDLDMSIVVTANEQTEYFKVMLKALSFLYPEVAKKTVHVTHGMLTTPEGKMSSRKGNVIGGGTLFDEAERLALKKTKEGKKFDSKEEEKKASQIIALSALRFAILRQSPGKNVVFDLDRSLSLEGDSGPYLQYSVTRASSALNRAKSLGIKPDSEKKVFLNTELERLLYRFPEVVSRAQEEFAPHYIINYLIAISSSFNNFYSEQRIADSSDSTSGYKMVLVKSFKTVMENGLYLLGIKIPEKM